MSSGLIGKEPVNHYLIPGRGTDLAINNSHPLPDVNKLYFYGGSKPFASIHSDKIGYSFVTETRSKKGISNGYIIYKYHNVPDNDRAPIGFPHYITIPDQLNGSLLNQSVYNNDSIIQTRTEYKYELIKSDTLVGLKSFNEIGSLFNDTGGAGNFWRFYYRIPQQYKLKEEICENYIKGIASQIHKVDYEYTSEYSLLKSKKSIGSNNDNIEELIKYPSDLPSNIHTDMIKKGMFGIPVETISLINGNVISASKTLYKDTLSKFVPSSQYSFHSATPKSLSDYSNYYTLDYIYSLYNSKGKLLESIDKNKNLFTSYIWDTNNQYPIAIIQNAKYNDIISEFKDYNIGGTNLPD